MTERIKRYAKDKSGFSLSELMVVIALICVLSAIAVPSFLRTLPEKRLKNAAINLYADLQKARLLAVKHNTRVTVTFNTANGTYSYPNGSEMITVRLTDYGNVRYGIGSAPTNSCIWNNTSSCSPAASVIFFSTGIANPAGDIYLQNQNNDISYAATVTQFGAVKLRRFGKAGWEK